MNDADEVKSKLNIIDVIGERVTLKKTGRNYKGLCPFHNEKTPSFMVSPDRQVFHCFGCGKGGSVIDFIMEYFHMDFSEALENLADKAGVTLTRRAGDTPELKLKTKLYEVNALASEYYSYILTKHSLGQKALLYLKNRGISDKSIKTFSIGYSPNSWEDLYRFLKKKKYDDSLMETAGLVISGNHGLYDRFRGRVMFALKDHRGNVVGFSGRVLDPTIKEAKYINTSETPVYIKSNVLFALDVTKDAIAKANEAIIMEGEFDVISSFQAGIANVVAIKGSALTEHHVALLKRFTERLTFCLDSDVAGDAAARRGIDIAEGAGMDMRVVAIADGKDPDEAVRTNAVVFKKAVHDAIPIYDYFIQSAVKRFDTTSSYGKKKASEELLPILKRITNAVVQAHYVKKVAESLGVSEDAVENGMAKVKSPIGKSQSEEEQEPLENLSRQEKIELYLLALLLQGDTYTLLQSMKEKIHVSDIKHVGVKRIYEALCQYLSDDAPFDIQAFATTLPKEVVPILDQAYLVDMSPFVESPEKFAEEWKKTTRLFLQLTIREKIKQKTEHLKIHDSEELGNELTELSAKLKALDKGE